MCMTFGYSLSMLKICCPDVSVVQGIGAGGIASLTQIIISDLVPLKERGSFNGLIAM